MSAAALLDWSARVRALLDELPGLLGEQPANDAGAGETLDAYASRWFAARRTARPADERRTYEIWIQPTLGARLVTQLARDDVEGWVEQMDAHVAAGRILSGTAGRIWTLFATMLRDTANAKARGLRVRPDNPARGVRGPDRSPARASTFLYPSEFLRLMRCRRVPIAFRRLYALTVYLYPRAGELRALEWADLDVRTGRAHVHRSLDRKGKVGRTKSQSDRQFIAERRILPLLRVMHRAAGGKGLVLPVIHQRQNLARALRGHLRVAGCTRADIYADDDGRRPLTYHDLRATGITWMAMRGDSPTDILERVGHAHLSTTERYIRRGRLLARAAGERVFPALPPELLRR